MKIYLNLVRINHEQHSLKMQHTANIASPNMRARNLRMRDWSASKGANTSSPQSNSSASLASINSGMFSGRRQAGATNTASHFRIAGNYVMNQQQQSARNAA